MLASFPPPDALHGHPEGTEASDSSEDSFVTATGSGADVEAVAAVADEAAVATPPEAAPALAVEADMEVATAKAAPAETPPAEAETTTDKAAPAEAHGIPAGLADDMGEGGPGDSPEDSTLALVVSPTTWVLSEALRCTWPVVLPHAPPGFAAEFRAVSEDPRFGAALFDDISEDNSEEDWDFWGDVARLMLVGGESGYIGRAG